MQWVIHVRIVIEVEKYLACVVHSFFVEECLRFNRKIQKL